MLSLLLREHITVRCLVQPFKAKMQAKLLVEETELQCLAQGAEHKAMSKRQRVGVPHSPFPQQHKD